MRLLVVSGMVAFLIAVDQGSNILSPVFVTPSNVAGGMFIETGFQIPRGKIV